MSGMGELAPFLWIEEGKEQVQTPRTRKWTKKKKEFVGWGSRQLIEFLESIGKDTSNARTQDEATQIITQYINENRLIHPDKKKRVLCDEKLHALFGRKSISRVNIFKLLDVHLVANQADSDGDYSSEEKEEATPAVCKRQKVSSSDGKTQSTKKAAVVSQSSLAAIDPENIKLVYLKRTLVQELLKHPETFEGKVVGSFVRIKADPFDIFQKNSHVLQLVTGVKAVAGDNSSCTILQISGVENETSVSALSDDNFSEEECEDLHKRVKDGLIKQPTVGELEQKVGVLHEDITKHWLARELALLKKLVDRANEKGWRHRVMEYLDRKRLLETPSEQSRLLSEIPKVRAEVKAETIAEGPQKVVIQDTDDLPKASDWDWEPCNDSANKGVTAKVSSKQDGQVEVGTGTGSNGHAQFLLPVEGALSKAKAVRAESNERSNGHAHSFDLNERHLPNMEAVGHEGNGHTKSPSPDHIQFPRTEEMRGESNGHLHPPSSKNTDVCNTEHVQMKQMEVIDLSDDDEEQEVPCSRKQILDPSPEELMWYYHDPRQNVQGPFSLASLKRWWDAEYFPATFSVWRVGQRPEDAVLLSEILIKNF